PTWRPAVRKSTLTLIVTRSITPCAPLPLPPPTRGGGRSGFVGPLRGPSPGMTGIFWRRRLRSDAPAPAWYRAAGWLRRRDEVAPDRPLVEAQRGKLRGAQRRLAGGEELVELRRGHPGAGQHGVRLAAMVHLVLEQVQQDAVRAVDLDAILAVHACR